MIEVIGKMFCQTFKEYIEDAHEAVDGFFISIRSFSSETVIVQDCLDTASHRIGRDICSHIPLPRMASLRIGSGTRCDVGRGRD